VIEALDEEALAALPCAERAEALGEELAGSAPAERLVLVVEQTGPWGRDAVKESGLRPIAGELEAHAKAAGARIQVVRRRTRRYAQHGTTAWLAGVAPGSRFLERFELGEAEALLDLPLGREPAGGGTLQRDPLLLCCTHSTRDPCCARRGIPLHRALTASGAETWHASHLGGHRFAATMAVLPLGAWLGRVPAERAPEVVALVHDGRVPLDLLRGIAGLPAPAQAADLALRRHLGVDRVDDLRFEHLEGGVATFTSADGGRHEVGVEHVASGRERAVSCGAGAKSEDPGRYEVRL